MSPFRFLITMDRYSALATLVQGSVLVVSLHIVRLCGLRLARVSPDENDAADRPTV
jgi:hypothetical protein